MQFALVVVGAMIGLALDSGGGMRWLFSMVVGGFAGYALAELSALRTRSGELEREVRGLKERLAAEQRQRGGMGAAAPRVASEGSAASAESKSAVPSVPASVAPDVSAAPRASGAPGMSASGASNSWTSPSQAPGYDDRDPSTIVRVLREFFTGGNTLVRVGVLILFFGVAFLLRYLAEHTQVPIQFRLSA
ncbi:MAG TPA: hypothetical protein VGC34_14910, partial [Steroidobacteraceae bacterium]